MAKLTRKNFLKGAALGTISLPFLIRGCGPTNLAQNVPSSSNIITNKKFEGAYLHLSNWGTYNGQQEALAAEDEACLKYNREVKDPSSQFLFTEMTRPLFDQVTDFLEEFYKRY